MKLTYPSNKVCPKCGTGGYVWYLDNSEYVAKCTNCGHYFHREDFPMCVLDEAPKPTTNADRIRSMTDEELAELFISIQDDVANYFKSGAETEPEFPTFTSTWLYWLKEESKGDT